MFHVELRQFPHSACRFNLSEQEMRALVDPWAREEWVEMGERKWSPHQARLKVLEGPQIPVEQLSMGRGWPLAERRSEDVTEDLLARARESRDAATRASHDLASDLADDLALQADSLGLGLLSVLEQAPAPLSRAWRLAQARFPELSASESLALAERAVRGLLQGRLVVLVHPGPAAGEGAADPGDGALEVPEGQLEPLLRAVESWTDADEIDAVRLRRA
jgi:hypothetical protein